MGRVPSRVQLLEMCAHQLLVFLFYSITVAQKSSGRGLCSNPCTHLSTAPNTSYSTTVHRQTSNFDSVQPGHANPPNPHRIVLDKFWQSQLGDPCTGGTVSNMFHRCSCQGFPCHGVSLPVLTCTPFSQALRVSSPWVFNSANWAASLASAGQQ